MTVITDDIVARELFDKKDAAEFTVSECRLVEAALEDVDRMMEVFLKKSLSHVAHTEIRSGGEPTWNVQAIPAEELSQRRDTIHLINVPVALTGLVVEENPNAETFDATHELTIGTDYQLEGQVEESDSNVYSSTGVLRRLCGRSWPLRPGAVRITYYGGPSTINWSEFFSALRLAEMSTFRSVYLKKKHFHALLSTSGRNLKSEDIGKYEREYQIGPGSIAYEDGIPSEAVGYLHPYLSMRTFM